MYALGILWDCFIIFWAGFGVTFGVLWMLRFRSRVSFGCFPGYVLLRACVLRAYYAVGRSRSGDCLAGFVCNHVGWLFACVVTRAFVVCVVPFL